MIKVSVISYLNSLPFVYGIKTSKLSEQIDVSLNIPSKSANLLIDNKIDLALAPVAVIPFLKNPKLHTNYCIGSNGPVDTVCIYSDVPMNSISSIELDYQSRTSIELLIILLRDYWRVNPKLIYSDIGFEQNISGNKAGLVIGDRAFDLNKKYKYIYDLSLSWKKMTGLPFVFAAWISNKELPENFISELEMALKKGVNNISDSLVYAQKKYNEQSINFDYLNKKISYFFDRNKRTALDLFLQKIEKK
tara:strand:- start:1374 stop:2117 length:744 start_codon:yes stop_codon:yes gene_type:complete